MSAGGKEKAPVVLSNLGRATLQGPTQATLRLNIPTYDPNLSVWRKRPQAFALEEFGEVHQGLPSHPNFTNLLQVVEFYPFGKFSAIDD